jgi:hypothetical protein
MSQSGRPSLPRQENLDIAVSRALEALRRQNEPMLAWLGTDRDERGRIRISVLGRRMSVDFEVGRLVLENGEPVDPRWQVLVIHYLGAPAPVEPTGREIVFADIPDTRGYQGVYQNRVIKRLCHTAGRTAELLSRGSQAVGGEACSGEGDLAFCFHVLPRVPLRLVWSAGDEDFPPNAAFLFQSYVSSLLPPEDIVVLSELIVSQICRAVK